MGGTVGPELDENLAVAAIERRLREAVRHRAPRSAVEVLKRRSEQRRSRNRIEPCRSRPWSPARPPPSRPRRSPTRSSPCSSACRSASALRAAAAAAGRGGVHPPRLPRLLSGGALLGQVPWARALARAGPARLKEWVYAGFAIDLGSALIAHFSVAMAPGWAWAAATALFWALSYVLWRRRQSTPVFA